MSTPMSSSENSEISLSNLIPESIDLVTPKSVGRYIFLPLSQSSNSLASCR